MKKLHLPKTILIRFHSDGEQPKTNTSGVDITDEIAVIEKNGSEIISATIMIEDRMIEAVSKILFGASNDKTEYREFYANEIMGTSGFSYTFKRRVFTRLLEHFKIIEQEKINNLKARLNKIMEWRNAFAHGQVLHECNVGFVLQYYRDGQQKLLLNDRFFEIVEETIRSCLYTCNGIIQSQQKES